MYFHAEKEKVPSQICYCTNPRNPMKPGDTYRWGSDAEEYCLRKPHQLFKLQLGAGATRHEYGNCVNDKGAIVNMLRSPLELFVELLSGMRLEFMRRIIQFYSQKHSQEYDEQDFLIDWFFTIPVFFNKDLALSANLLAKDLPRAGFKETDIHHIYEPQAAAIRVLSQSLLLSNSQALYYASKSPSVPRIKVRIYMIQLLAIENLPDLF